MAIYLVNLIYFVIVLPIVFVAFPIVLKLNNKENKNHVKIIVVLCILFFLVRFPLVLFSETIGIMPYLVEDVLFYSLLAVFGIGVTWVYITKIEKVSFKDLGWEIEDLKKSLVFSLLSFIPLIAMFPVMMILGNIQLAVSVSWEKLVVTLSFTILAAVYEELMFRGIIQNHISELTDDKKIIVLLTAFLFTITHLFYLPFIGFGIFYIFVFIMAFLLSILRIIADQLACAILHGGIVFILILAV